MRRFSRIAFAVTLVAPATAFGSIEDLPAAFDHWELGLLVAASLVLYKRWSATRYLPPAPPPQG